MLGDGWNNELWGGELPVASWIDDVTPKNPVSHNLFDNNTFLHIVHFSTDKSCCAGLAN